MTLPPGLPAVREEDDCFVRKRGIFAIAVASAVLAGCGGDNEVERQVKQRLGPVRLRTVIPAKTIPIGGRAT